MLFCRTSTRDSVDQVERGSELWGAILFDVIAGYCALIEMIRLLGTISSKRKGKFDVNQTPCIDLGCNKHIQGE